MSNRESMEAIERINAVRRRVVPAPRLTPHGLRCRVCGQSLRVLTSHPPPSAKRDAIDILWLTLYACPKDRLLWLHERGGILGSDTWLGPVTAAADELEGLTDSLPGS